MTTSVRLTDLFRYWKALPHQQAGIQMLGELIPAELLSRDQEWFKVWSQSGRVPAPDWLAPSLEIIKRFEGLNLNAYPDPGTGGAPWTIGWGSTRLIDRPVQPGDAITAEMADELLINEVERKAADLFRLLPVAREWDCRRQAALISWIFNVGAGAAAESTLVRLIKAGDDPAKVVADQLPRWNKAGGKPMLGLTNRRAAEVALFISNAPAAPDTPPPQAPSRGNPLSVPWFSQRDSETAQRDRMCMSSSCAMLLAYLRPGALKGPNGDDQYLHRLQSYGDTTDPRAHVHALQSFGVHATFTEKADFDLIERQIAKGVPVPVGFLHRGPLNAPTGGHWLIVCGITETHLIVHDPWGEPDLITGHTVSSVARYCRLTRRNFAKRWMVTQDADGSYSYAPGHGWAIVAEA